MEDSELQLYIYIYICFLKKILLGSYTSPLQCSKQLINQQWSKNVQIPRYEARGRKDEALLFQNQSKNLQQFHHALLLSIFHTQLHNNNNVDPLLGNDRKTNRFPRQRINTQQQRKCWKRCFLWSAPQPLPKDVSAARNRHSATEERCFLCGPFRDVISRRG
jgi:hypothetical protein